MAAIPLSAMTLPASVNRSRRRQKPGASAAAVRTRPNEIADPSDEQRLRHPSPGCGHEQGRDRRADSHRRDHRPIAAGVEVEHVPGKDRHHRHEREAEDRERSDEGDERTGPWVIADVSDALAQRFTLRDSSRRREEYRSS